MKHIFRTLILFASALLILSLPARLCAAGEETWQEEYTVDTKYNRAIYRITYERGAKGEVTYSLKKIENVMKMPYYNQQVDWGGKYVGTGDPMDPDNYNQKRIVKSYYANSVGDSSDACGPFSYSMAVSFLKERTILPTAHNNTDKWYNSLYTDYQICNHAITPKHVKSCLLANKPVIYLCKASNGGEKCPFSDWHHYMILTGVKKDGTITMHDPNDFTGSKYGNWEGLKKTSYIMGQPDHQKSWKLKKLKEYGDLYILMYNEGEKEGTKASKVSLAKAEEYAAMRAREAEEGR